MSNKKHPSEMTTEELAKKLFPTKLRDELKKVAHEKDEDEREKSKDNNSSQT